MECNDRLVWGLNATVPIIDVINPIRATVVLTNWVNNHQVNVCNHHEHRCYWDSDCNCKNEVDNEAWKTEVVTKKLFHFVYDFKSE